MKLVLDTKKQLSSRLFFLSREDDYEWTQNFVLTKEVPFCKTYDVYLIVSLIVCVTGAEILIINVSAQCSRQADWSGGSVIMSAARA